LFTENDETKPCKRPMTTTRTFRSDGKAKSKAKGEKRPPQKAKSDKRAEKLIYYEA